MKLILQFIKPHWKLCVITILLLIIDVTGALIISTFAAEMLNLGISGTSFETLLITGAKMAAASIISSLCAILGGYACATLSAQIGKDMRVAIYKNPLSFLFTISGSLERLPLQPVQYRTLQLSNLPLQALYRWYCRFL